VCEGWRILIFQAAAAADTGLTRIVPCLSRAS